MNDPPKMVHCSTDLKREQIAREILRLPCTEIKAKIKQKTREYKEFCGKCNVPERTTNLRVDSTAADVTKTGAYAKYEHISRSSTYHETVVKGDEKRYNRYRKTSNVQSELKEYTEPLQLKHVRKVMQEMGIDFGSAKIKIIRDEQLKGTGYFGWTNPNMKEVQLYPDAFKNRNELVKPLGHERVHLEQLRLFGPAENHDEAIYFEKGPIFSEEYWWDEYKRKVNYNE